MSRQFTMLPACAVLGVFLLPGAAEDKTSPGETTKLPVVYESIVIRSTVIEPSVDRRDSEVFRETLFGRDDQVFHLLGAGINAGQHEGGGKSVELRRFGFNLDHGGVGGGLKVLVDNVGQNQSTQGHGQGYLGSLKSLTPELVQDVDIINGPFSAEYGDFSGLGVVHIRLREQMPDEFTARVQGGSYGTKRGFFAFSPQWKGRDVLLAWEGSYSDGPFLKPLDYRRHNVTGNIGWTQGARDRWSVRWNGGINRFNSSGQLPLDEVAAGRLDRYGSLSEGDGGDAINGTAALYFRREYAGGSVLKADGFLTRSLLDLYSNFTFYLNDPVNGDGIRQHDSRLQQGANLQFMRPTLWGGVPGTFVAGSNFHANQINVGLDTRFIRTPLEPVTSAHARVANGAGYVQQDVSLANGRLRAGAGLRWDTFHFALQDRINPHTSGARTSSLLQPKASLAWRPFWSLPVTLHANYGRGISSLDARGIVTHRDSPAVSTTDFYQAGIAANAHRIHLAASLFRIGRSNELVYVADDGSTEFKGPSRSVGAEIKSSIEFTRWLSVAAGLTKVSNAFYTGTFPRAYVTTAPHLVANAGLTLSALRGWSGSLRMRAINGYRLDELEPSIRAAGHTVWDFGVARRITRFADVNLAVDNLFDRAYYEMQNYFESAIVPGQPAYRIHGTPGYGRTILVGMTFRFGGK
jgi:hypothetical protein